MMTTPSKTGSTSWIYGAGQRRKSSRATRVSTCTQALEGEFATGTGDGKLLAYLAEDAGHPTDIWLRDAGR